MLTASLPPPRRMPPTRTRTSEAAPRTRLRKSTDSSNRSSAWNPITSPPTRPWISSIKKIGQLSDTCKDNGVVFNQNGDLLDRFSEKGTKTKQALEDIASSAQNAAEKILKQGENTNFTNGEIDRAKGVLADAREALIKQAERREWGSRQPTTSPTVGV